MRRCRRTRANSADCIASRSLAHIRRCTFADSREPPKGTTQHRTVVSCHSDCGVPSHSLHQNLRQGPDGSKKRTESERRTEESHSNHIVCSTGVMRLGGRRVASDFAGVHEQDVLSTTGQREHLLFIKDNTAHPLFHVGVGHMPVLVQNVAVRSDYLYSVLGLAARIPHTLHQPERTLICLNNMARPLCSLHVAHLVHAGHLSVTRLHSIRILPCLVDVRHVCGCRAWTEPETQQQFGRFNGLFFRRSALCVSGICTLRAGDLHFACRRSALCVSGNCCVMVPDECISRETSCKMSD